MMTSGPNAKEYTSRCTCRGEKLLSGSHVCGTSLQEEGRYCTDDILITLEDNLLKLGTESRSKFMPISRTLAIKILSHTNLSLEKRWSKTSLLSPTGNIRRSPSFLETWKMYT